MENLVITVEIKTSYGTERIYPICDKALKFTELTGTKTLSKYDINIIKGLGYTVKVKHTTPTTL